LVSEIGTTYDNCRKDFSACLWTKGGYAG